MIDVKLIMNIERCSIITNNELSDFLYKNCYLLQRKSAQTFIICLLDKLRDQFCDSKLKVKMAGGKHCSNRTVSPFIEREAQVEGDDSGDEVLPETATIDSTDCEDHSPQIDSSSTSQRALDALSENKGAKNGNAKLLPVLQDEGKEDVDIMRRRELLKKLRGEGGVQGNTKWQLPLQACLLSALPCSNERINLRAWGHLPMVSQQMQPSK